mmetsp:Transcript_122776/g.319267  ORF Transcript_122776/g.319267 Transcript_122776/m.319267 type:complete len:210 (+) Transcript_122776:409-1038(+)
MCRREFREYYFSRIVVDMAKTLHGLLNPCIAMQFTGSNCMTQIVPYTDRKWADIATPQVLAKFDEVEFMLDGHPTRRLLEGTVWPISAFSLDRPYELIPCGMSFTTYPLKKGVTLEMWNGLYTNEIVKLLSSEFGILWLFSAVDIAAEDGPVGVVSALYLCEEAAQMVQPKIGEVLKRMGCLELMRGLPYERTVGKGWTLRTPLAAPGS